MAQFIERACSMREAADDAPSWLRRQSASVGRTLQLSEAEAVELFGLLDGAEFSITGRRLCHAHRAARAYRA